MQCIDSNSHKPSIINHSDWIDESDAGDMGGKDCEDGGGL